MKTLSLTLLVLLALVACGKAEDKPAANPLVGTWSLVSGPGPSGPFTFIYAADGTCHWGTASTAAPDTCAYTGPTLSIKSSSDGLTDDYAISITGNQMTMLQAGLPETYRFNFSK